MTGSLIKIDKEIVTSAVASVTLGGADWDSSYDVYMVKFNKVVPDTDNQNLKMRFGVGGTPDTSSNYDVAFKLLRTDATFSNEGVTNSDNFQILNNVGTATSEIGNSIMYLFNFNNASEYSFYTLEANVLNSVGTLKGRQGGGVLTVAQATNSVQFFFSSGNIDIGSTFTLYGLKK